MGSLKNFIAMHTEYNLWANSRLVNWLQTLDNSLLEADTPSSFRSIGLTLQHLVHAQNFWLPVITGTFIARGDEQMVVNGGIAAMQNLLDGSEK